MDIEIGTKIYIGGCSPHECTDSDVKFVHVRGFLVNSCGEKHKYDFMQCVKCGALTIGTTAYNKKIKTKYPNYEFISVEKRKNIKSKSSLSKKQIRNNKKLLDELLGKKVKGRKKKTPIPPVYPGDEVAPKYIQQSVFHPYSGGSFSSK